jgi:hypothetical protein
LDGEAPKVQRASSRKAHQQTHKEARHLAGRGGGTLGLASDGEDGKTRNPKAGSGRRAINKDRNTRALEVRQGSRASDASKSHQRTEEAAHPPAYWDSGLHKRASEGEYENNWSPTATQAGDTGAWVQTWEATYAQNKPNPAAHHGGGTRAPPGQTALPGLAALVGPATSRKNKRKTGQSASAANFLSAQEPQLKEEAAIAHGVRRASPSHQVGGAWSAKHQGITSQGVSAAGVVLAQEPYDLESDEEPKAEDEHRHTPEAADWEAMRILANNRSVRSTTAARMARDTATTEAAPSWTGIGAN